MAADALVLFGATGDLAKKMLFPALYGLVLRGALEVPIVGVASSAWDDDGLRDYAAKAVHAASDDVDDAALEELTDRLTFVSGDYADALRDEKVKVLRSIRPLDPQEVVRGQYDGYRDEPGVDRSSEVETFAALRLHIDSWRWSGVPWVIRTGKLLPVTATEAVVEFHAPPRLLFAGHDDEPPHPNQLRVRLGPDDGISLGLQTKRPGRTLATQGIDLSVDYARALGERERAYERLLQDAMVGDRARFAREDGVEAAWRIVEPALGTSPPVHAYEPGTWGPPEADRLVPGGWHEPRAGLRR